MASPDLALGRHRILFIDAYDSFANNIFALLKTKLEEVVEIEVTIIRIDAYIPDFLKFLKGFDAVVAGPGQASREVSGMWDGCVSFGRFRVQISCQCWAFALGSRVSYSPLEVWSINFLTPVMELRPTSTTITTTYSTV
ncbi:MAG: para-aminobenzoate synthase [Lasallia pustulata]|uniref:Para-aminobenzoate synthase n=1 Tax=Lasallia pustulata TaxID=136370 RepID=A0A5M8PZV6_9LECA|nr:MAG: para-aminobenzoate synthase [Lasallia pustulata]